MKDLKVRTLTAIVLILVLIPFITFGSYLNGLIISIFLVTLSILATYELEHMYYLDSKMGYHSYLNMALSCLSYIVFTYSLISNNYKYIVIYMFIVFLVQGIILVCDKNLDINNLSRSLLSIFYPSLGFSSLAFLRVVLNDGTLINLQGIFLFLFPVLICAFTDTFAYTFGCKYGKHKLSPISPKKSIEGSIAGTVFGVVLPVIFAYFTNVSSYLFSFTDNTIVQILLTALLSLILSVIDEFGDLFASKLKRHYGLKDYSNLFPGHGGVLDRFDSYIFVGIALSLYIIIVLV